MRIKFLIFIFIVFLIFPLFAQDNEIVMRVTGKTIDAKTLAGMVKNYLVQINALDKDTDVKITNLPVKMKTNSSADVTVTAGDGGTQKKIKVKIENCDMPDTEPVFLMFSNYPEKVISYGMLFNAACVTRKKVRIQLYHLSNMKDKNPYLSFRFYNPDKTKSSYVYIVGDLRGPSENFMKIGHENNISFLNNKENKLGIIYEVKPGSSFNLINEEMPHDKLFCGIFEMYLMEGPPLYFYIFSNRTKDETLIYPEVTSTTDTHARGVYMVTDFTYDVKFETREKEKYITFGDTPLRNIFPHKKLAGDYGAIYNINLLAENNIGKSVKLEIIFQPRGGIATGTFIVDGRLLEVPFTKPKVEKKIWSYVLRPYEKRLIKIKTMPEGASYYPIRIIFRAE